jgi:hypothetical protein
VPAPAQTPTPRRAISAASGSGGKTANITGPEIEPERLVAQTFWQCGAGHADAFSVAAWRAANASFINIAIVAEADLRVITESSLIASATVVGTW